jgi:hypothetical protein
VTLRSGPQRERVVPVRAALADLTVLVVDQMLDVLALRRLATCSLSGILRREHLRDAICSFASVRPSALVRDGVHIRLAHE